ncbi:MAG: 1-acyl-sn-glycerol-3-phosphate acyltransferase [Anaerolineales bacterium]|nr:1-acyl-sn-glycerol-3-phosphate acyltransferase [Anaerolineales bacterium]
MTNWLINFCIRIYTRLTCRIDAPNLKDFPQTGPLIAIANHTGQIEAPLLFAHLQPRQLTGWAKAEIWENWFLRWVFTSWGAIPVHRGEADTAALKLALKALKAGKIFGLAPEGTRNKTGKLIRAMPGMALVALHSGAPIVPIAHWGGENYLANLKRFKRTDFHIRVGKPFQLKVESLKAEGLKVTAEIRQQIVDEMMYELAKLLPEEYRGEYADLSKATRRWLESCEG